MGRGKPSAKLNSNAELNMAILSFITPKDDLKVEPDEKDNLVRIIFSRPSEIKSGLIHGTLFAFDRKILPKEAIEAIDKIASLIQ